MKLWQKNYQVDQEIERFTVGRDRELDLELAPYDIQGSLAHIKMLCQVGLLEEDELVQLVKGLQALYKEAEAGQFVIEEGIEDVHSQVEHLLIQQQGVIGKKIHSGRSRNDQVLVDLKLYLRAQVRQIIQDVERLFQTLLPYQSSTRISKCRAIPTYRWPWFPLLVCGLVLMQRVWWMICSNGSALLRSSIRTLWDQRRATVPPFPLIGR